MTLIGGEAEKDAGGAGGSGAGGSCFCVLLANVQEDSAGAVGRLAVYVRTAIRRPGLLSEGDTEGDQPRPSCSQMALA